MITPTSFNFLTFPSSSFTLEFAQKRGGLTPCCTKCSKCSSTSVVDLLEEKTFLNSSLYLELDEIPHSQYMIAPIYLYNLLSSGNLEIDDILSKLAKEEIIGEDPGKHWEKRKLLCKLELKDPEFRIQNKKIESN